MTTSSPCAPSAALALAKLDAVRGVIGARAGDDAGTVADRLEYGPQQGELLGVGGGRRLAGGAG